MFLGNIFFNRPGAPKDSENIQIGSIWYDDRSHRASILLNGFYIGQWACVPFPKHRQLCDQLDLSGSIMVHTGEFEKDGLNRKKYLWCGFVQCSNDERGTVYWGVLEVLPIATFITAAKEAVIAQQEGNTSHRPGLWLNIFLNSDEKHGYVKPGIADVFADPVEPKEKEDQDDLPW